MTSRRTVLGLGDKIHIYSLSINFPLKPLPRYFMSKSMRTLSWIYSYIFFAVFSNLSEMPCLLCEEKQFPVRSVPESLEKAANDSFAALSKQGLLEGDLMKAYISLGTCFGNVFSCRK